AALAAAIAMMIGLTVMIFSFRRSLEAWINHGIVADLFIAPASNDVLGIAADVPPAAIDWLRARPEVESVDTFREQEVRVQGLDGKSESALLAVLRGRYRDNLQFVGAARDSQVSQVFAGEGVAVTESFARRHRARDGDEITLRTPRGLLTVRVFGTYLDYSRDQGVIMMHRDLFDRHWPEAGVHSLAVFLEDAAHAAPLADAFREHFAGKGEFAIYSNRTLRDRILSIFDQAFAVTEVLRTVAIIVAIAGIFLSVTTLVTERQREIGMLRAIGASRGQVRALFMAEAAMIGLLSSALGLGAGCLLAMVLTWVVNPAFFGWTIQLQFPAAALAATPLWIVPVTLIAAAYPAHRAAGAPIAEAIREE
ncbi:MAG: FtsX-like permease family protein, partial [Verrucomicrobiota bacterium]|nr:FtsX-like permease family protein [Verrucomicrobiota bacterium]